MSLFSKEELQEFLQNTKETLKNEGITQNEIEKLSKKAFTKWLKEFIEPLKEEIKAINPLPVNQKEQRVKRAFKDFHYFRKTYFPHYYTLKGKSLLQQDLEDTYKKIIDPNKTTGLKFAKAAPRGFGKSTDVSLVFIIYLIVYELKKFSVIISDAIELTETIIESIKAELEENPRLKQDFPHATGVGKIWRVGEFVSKNNIKVKGFGSGKRIRGIKHGTNRPDLAVIDDLENDINVKSRKQRDKLEEWLDEAIDNLGSVDGKMDIIYIGTILHKDSVLARKLKLKFWHPKIFRALISYPTHIELWNEYSRLFKYQSIEDAHNFYLENKATMDKGAKLLWDAVSLEYLMQKRATNPKAFAKEQQNNPNAENQKFDSSKFIKISPTQMPKLDRKFLYVDAKGDSQAGDYCGFVGAGVNYKDQKLYVFLSKQSRIKGKAVIDEIIKLQKIYNFDLISGDRNGGFYMLRDWLKERAFNEGVFIKATKFIHHTDNKEDRMGELEFPIDDGDIIFVGEHPELFAQMDDFPEADHDDLHDPLSAIYRLSRIKYKHSRKRTNIRRYKKKHKGYA